MFMTIVINQIVFNEFATLWSIQLELIEFVEMINKEQQIDRGLEPRQQTPQLYSHTQPFTVLH